MVLKGTTARKPCQTPNGTTAEGPALRAKAEGNLHLAAKTQPRISVVQPAMLSGCTEPQALIVEGFRLWAR